MSRKNPLITDLKARRQTLGWSIRQLSEECGLDEQSLTDWEQGMSSPQLEAAETWAVALGVRLGVLPSESGGTAGLRIDWTARCVSVDGAIIRLTPMEWKALERLAWSPGEIVTHQELFQYLYGDERRYRAESTAVRVLITKLRRLLPVRIEARWGKGYVISDIDPAGNSVPAGSFVRPSERTGAEHVVQRKQREVVQFAPRPVPRDPPPIRRERTEFADLGIRRLAAPAPRPSECRAEELGVIERFLAERGTTRCPDVATIQKEPLPTLIWDKMKRKWVRPSLPVSAPAMDAREAS